MKVAFLFLHPFSASLGSTVRIRELAISLHKSGVQCFILTPYEKSQTLYDGIEVICIDKFLQSSGLSDQIYRLTKSAYYNGFLVRRFLNTNSLRKLTSRILDSVAKVIKELEIDILQIEQDFAAMAAKDVMVSIKIPVVVDLHNITSEELVAANVISNHSKEYDLLQWQTQETLQQVDCIAVVSKGMKDYVVTKYGVSSSDVIIVPPGGRPRVESVNLRRFPPKVIYSGLVSYREHLDLFVRSMAKLDKSKNIKCYVTKRGRWLKEMKCLAEELNVHPLYFWYPNKIDFYDFLSSCSVGILPSSNDLARQMGTPVKLFDYFSVGLPVVANDVGTWTNIIKEEQVGVVTMDDPSAFARGIMRIIEDEEFALNCGRRGLELVKNKYNWDKSAEPLFCKYQTLA